MEAVFLFFLPFRRLNGNMSVCIIFSSVHNECRSIGRLVVVVRSAGLVFFT
jgi:hypothetical protein